MRIICSEDFDHNFSKLPKNIQRFFEIQKERFVNNWRDSRLHIKKVYSLEYAFSFRITRQYRVLFYFQDMTTVIFFDIDHRKDIYKHL